MDYKTEVADFQAQFVVLEQGKNEESGHTFWLLRSGSPVYTSFNEAEKVARSRAVSNMRPTAVASFLDMFNPVVDVRRDPLPPVKRTRTKDEIEKARESLDDFMNGRM